MSELHTPDDTTDLRISFQRDPKEHASVMLSVAGRYYPQSKEARMKALGLRLILWVAIIALVLWYNPVIPDLPQSAPLMLAAFAVIYVIVVSRMNRQSLIERMMARLAPAEKVDLHLDRSGVTMQEGGLSLCAEWASIRAVEMRDSRIDIDLETMMIYAPARAFRDDKAFHQALVDIRQLWHHGRERALSQAETPTRR